MAELLSARDVRLLEPVLGSRERLPAMLDYFRVRLATERPAEPTAD